MIIGIGTDLVHIPRMVELLDKYGDKIAERILAQQEFVEFTKQHKQAAFLAKRFAAKEAAVKAFGTGFRDGLSLRHIRVINNQQGRPCLQFEAKGLEMKQSMQIGRCFLSLTEDHEYAGAYVIFTDEAE